MHKWSTGEMVPHSVLTPPCTRFKNRIPAAPQSPLQILFHISPPPTHFNFFCTLRSRFTPIKDVRPSMTCFCNLRCSTFWDRLGVADAQRVVSCTPAASPCLLKLIATRAAVWRPCCVPQSQRERGSCAAPSLGPGSPFGGGDLAPCAHRREPRSLCGFAMFGRCLLQRRQLISQTV